jgi:putative nucleotidyltransferase with HDIG domain
LTLAIFFSFWLFIRFERFHLRPKQALLLGSLVIMASSFAGTVALSTPQLLPIAAISMSVSLFFRASVGFVSALLFAILCSQALSLSTGELVPHLVSAIVGARLCQRAKNRADLSRAAPWVGVAQVAAYLMVATLDQHMMGNVQGTVLHGSSGMISAFLVASGMPFLESFFGVVTRFRLLELSDPELPLLRRLRSEAPGTYQHTLAVADLAQAAAYRINADGELVRVGILYHDIGKILAPQLFVENQFENGNPHDHMSPRDSAAAIIRHVPEGLELGRKHKLPEPILNFIPAHQGTTRAGHFYRLACEEAGRELPEQEFRYPGPRPNSRETGIAMLADTVEAIIRSLGKDADPELVNKTIRKSVQMRRSEGELSETGLGDGELDKIADAFFDCWRSKQHVRVPYRS